MSHLLSLLSQAPRNETAQSSSLPQRSPEQIILKLLESEEVAQPARRARIWELAETLHCSIVGTCLSNAELRQVLRRLKIAAADNADDHQLHLLGVMLASRRDAGARVLTKALDRRHASALKRFAREKDESSLLAAWKDAMQSGDIPGAYWAVLTHPAATQAVIKKAFGDVHMLSHLVGAANRADVRRLRLLEEENAALQMKIERQHEQLRKGFVERDAKIRQLSEALTRRSTHIAPMNEELKHGFDLALKELEHRLSVEIGRRERLQERCDMLTASVAERDRFVGELTKQWQALNRELEVAERQFADAERGGGESELSDICLAGVTILYVGGRPHQTPLLRASAERVQATFMVHDGGIDDNSALLPGLISRANLVVFPVDCVSHDAAKTVKRLCRQMDKPYRPLRASGVVSFVAAIGEHWRTIVLGADRGVRNAHHGAGD